MVENQNVIRKLQPVEDIENCQLTLNNCDRIFNRFIVVSDVLNKMTVCHWNGMTFKMASDASN